MKSFKVTIMTSERVIYSGDVEKFMSENDLGRFEILYNHENYITVTIPTITKIVDGEGKEIIFFTSIGSLKLKDNDLILCCNVAERSEDINLQRAEKAKERALKRLEEKEDIDVRRNEAALRRADIRIKIAKEMI